MNTNDMIENRGAALRTQLKTLRAEAGKTQEQVGQVTGLLQHSVARFEAAEGASGSLRAFLRVLHGIDPNLTIAIVPATCDGEEEKSQKSDISY